MSFETDKILEQMYVMPTFARKDVEFVRGSGMTLIDEQGNEYLDFLSGIGVVSLGHCHPALVDAISEQAHKLIHVGNYYYIEQRGDVAKMISDMLNVPVLADGEQRDQSDESVWKSFFANSGAEANECAIKLARLYARKCFRAGRVSFVSAGSCLESGDISSQQDDSAEPVTPPHLIVALQGSFHGRTLATLAATAQPVKQAAFEPLPSGFVMTPLNDTDALENLFAERGDEICAVMVECIQGESGIHPCTEEFLCAVRRLTQEYGALLICDEIQSGVYRSGLPFAFQHFGITPDIVSIAKGVASGIPVGICSAREEIADAFETGDHGSTFGGSNIAMAAAYATLNVLSTQDFTDHISEVGAYLQKRLAEIPGVVDVRGLGLMVGADLVDDDEVPNAFDVVDAALDANVVINATGQRTLRFLPPLICEKEHVDMLIEKLAGIIEEPCR